MKGYMYILECANGCYYTGSTNDLERRLEEHQNGMGANFTRKHLPVKLVYYETFFRIDEAFYREKQVQAWSRKKKEALINSCFDKLSDLSKNYTQYPRTLEPSLRQAQRPEDDPFPEKNDPFPEPHPFPEPVEGNATTKKIKYV
jgi:putative endonuclease